MGRNEGTSCEEDSGCGVPAVGVMVVTDDGLNRDGEVGGVIGDSLVVLCTLGE